ncbi:MAG TPA: multicopper oxidase domain-containing protein [Bryobacteraceae bacterium]|nr:multicopper oxidase domain-containing protein [Bryobacteraceae bacterium]
MPEIWIQLENRPWDTAPNNIDRMTGQNIKTRETTSGGPGPSPVSVVLNSAIGNPPRTVTMFKPLTSGGNVVDALILRRYKPPVKPDKSDAWTIPDDRKINPWDLNEHDPSESGTMGTIPGPVIECTVGDSVIVHFRNRDQRTMPGIKTICFPFPLFGEICFPVPTQVPLPIEKLCHSLHPHGFVFKPESDGAYPLSPPDKNQPIPPAEAAAWASVPNFAGQFKQGDRVPPGGTFDYTWNTFGWPTTSGVWLYHDHSICDDDNIGLGAIGIIVIHNTADTQQEVDIRDLSDPTKLDPPLDPAFLPGGSATGNPVEFICFPFGKAQRVGVLPMHLQLLAAGSAQPTPPMPGMSGMQEHGKARAVAESISPRTILEGPFALELDKDLAFIERLCLPIYRTPPSKALFLQLFHALQGVDTCINGRVYLGNTPTLLAGIATRMRFGVVGMGSETHTFHIHGHRWFVPGPDGNTPVAIQGSPQVKAISQFEDTRIFGPANSFVFTINGASGSFLRAGSPAPENSKGEWHMHCHVLMHMMTGMMGSLLIVDGGEIALALPEGVPCPPDMGSPGGGGGGPNTSTVHIVDFQFNPDPVTIKAGDTVKWVWDNSNHSTRSDTNIWDSGVQNAGATFSHTFPAAGNFPYYCAVHGGPGGAGMHGTVVVNP